MKNAFITGGSSGIGQALGRELAQRGYRVALAARRLDLLQQEVTELTARGHEVLALPCDVGDAASVTAAVQEAVARWGPIDLAVANAGIGIPTKPHRFVVADAEMIMRVNYLGMLYLFDAVIPSMVERQSGHFAGVASIAGFRGLPGAAAYSASKAAMQTFLEGCRVQLASHGVAVSIVNPGYVATAMTDKNKFPMPFLMTAAQAGRKIARGIERRSREIEFPLPMVMLMRLARIVPNAIYDFATRPFAQRRIDSDKFRR